MAAALDKKASVQDYFFRQDLSNYGVRQGNSMQKLTVSE